DAADRADVSRMSLASSSSYETRKDYRSGKLVHIDRRCFLTGQAQIVSTVSSQWQYLRRLRVALGQNGENRRVAWSNVGVFAPRASISNRFYRCSRLDLRFQTDFVDVHAANIDLGRISSMFPPAKSQKIKKF